MARRAGESTWGRQLILHFDQFAPEGRTVEPDAEIGPGMRLVYDAACPMDIRVRLSERVMTAGECAPTLVIHGRDRAPDDWFGLEIDLPDAAHDIALTARNYPSYRLFPRLHFEEAGGRTGHIDLPDVAASGAFATRILSARLWADHPGITEARNLRLTLLIPSTQWFVMEIQEIRIKAVAHA